jgi:tRNA(fMet)-specific endonuclease VapC
MSGFLLDTDSVSFALRGQGRVASNLLNHRPSEIHVSSITLAELRFGAERKKSAKLHRLIDAFAGAVTVLPFDEEAASHFGPAATALEVRGVPIGQFDTLIAAHALATRLTLVTKNTKHFVRVAGLKTETWI